MSEVAYTVAATFDDPDVAEEWLRWLTEGHVAEVLAGGATSAVIVRMQGPKRWFEVRYRFPSMRAFEEYERNDAPRLRAEGLERFPPSRGVAYSRTLGVVTWATS